MEIFNIFDHFKRRVGSNTMVVNMDPSLPLDETITGNTDFLITEHGALGPILNLKDFKRLKFVQNTWAGVDSLARQLAGRQNLFSRDTAISQWHYFSPENQQGEPRPTLKLARLNHPKFSQLMAEYALAAVINLERRFKLALQLQAQKTWSSRWYLNNKRGNVDSTLFQSWTEGLSLLKRANCWYPGNWTDWTELSQTVERFYLLKAKLGHHNIKLDVYLQVWDAKF